jgi:hypothetical protein
MLHLYNSCSLLLTMFAITQTLQSNRFTKCISHSAFIPTSIPHILPENKLRNMALDTQSIIAVIALLITCPPTIWLLYRIYTRRQPRHNHGMCRSPQMLLVRIPKILAEISTLLPTHASHPSIPMSRQNILHHHQRYHTWSSHTTIMLEDLATAFNHDSRGKTASS